MLEFIVSGVLLAGATFVVLKRKLLTPWGTAGAILVSIPVLIASAWWFLSIMLLMMLFFGVTKFKFSIKEKLGVQEGLLGERGLVNVVANGGPLVIIAVIRILTGEIWPVYLYAAALATLASDTVASELGVFHRAYLITSFAEVRPGTNGGVSAAGEMYAFTASIFTTILILALAMMDGAVYSWRYVFIISITGFAGCNLDSLMGATLENRGIIGKSSVNFISIMFSVIVVALLI